MHLLKRRTLTSHQSPALDGFCESVLQLELGKMEKERNVGSSIFIKHSGVDFEPQKANTNLHLQAKDLIHVSLNVNVFEYILY